MKLKRLHTLAFAVVLLIGSMGMAPAQSAGGASGGGAGAGATGSVGTGGAIGPFTDGRGSNSSAGISGGINGGISGTNNPSVGFRPCGTTLQGTPCIPGRGLGTSGNSGTSTGVGR